jgi:hypothetical protein
MAHTCCHLTKRWDFFGTVGRQLASDASTTSIGRTDYSLKSLPNFHEEDNDLSRAFKSYMELYEKISRYYPGLFTKFWEAWWKVLAIFLPERIFKWCGEAGRYVEVDREDSKVGDKCGVDKNGANFGMNGSQIHKGSPNICLTKRERFLGEDTGYEADGESISFMVSQFLVRDLHEVSLTTFSDSFDFLLRE